MHDIQGIDRGVYNFCIKLASDQAFIGGTPERLFEINGVKIESDALAGTAFKADGVETHVIKESLLNSQKNIGEHQYVVDFIHEKCRQLCTKCSMDKTLRYWS